MASSGQKLEWLVILPDKEGALQKRMEVRTDHIDRVKSEASDDFWLVGGAMFTHPPTEADKTLPICGSAMLAYAETKEEVLARLKDDVYTTSEVWDWEKVQIWPFRSAIRKGT